MECRITGVVPVAGSWSGECCFAVRLMLASKTVKVKLVETLEHGRTHAVDILLSTGTLCRALLITGDTFMYVCIVCIMFVFINFQGIQW